MRKEIILKNISIADLKRAAKKMIFSSSGFRTLFAPREQSHSKKITNENALLLFFIAITFADYIHRKFPVHASIVIGKDSRPSSAIILTILESILIAKNIDLQNVHTVPSPQISAYTASQKNINAYCYVTASHNPVGYNGIKLGGPDGGILPSDQIAIIIREIHLHIDEYQEQSLKIPIIKSPDSQKWHLFSKKAYWEFLRKQTDLYRLPPLPSLTMLIDMNGSARTTSIDKKWIQSIGIGIHSILHEKPGRIAHQILPEGAALKQCTRQLYKAYKKTKNTLFAYVYDNDGDRGNILIYDPLLQKVVPLSPQLHFAIIVLAELKWHWYFYSDKKLAIIVNAPTSYLIEQIAKQFSATVFRCATGEANILKKVSAVEKEGYHVVIAGEGSTGGCILSAGKIRDPLAAITAIIKLYALDHSTSGHIRKHSCNTLLPNIIKQLPQYISTSPNEEQSVLHLHCQDIVELKQNYEKIFQRDFETKKSMLSHQFDIDTWQQENYEEDKMIPGPSQGHSMKHSHSDLSILFYNKKKQAIAFMWFRKSATEPVYRIMAEVSNNKKLFLKVLISWQRNILLEADSLLQNTETRYDRA